MRVLITGATGFLGNNLVRLMEGHSPRPVVLVRPAYDRRTLEHADCQIELGEMSDLPLLERLTGEVDAIVHCAALIHIGRTRLAESRAVNVGLTNNLARLAHQRGIRLIHISSVDALAPGRRDRPAQEDDVDPSKPACAYVVSKREADRALETWAAKGLDLTIVHPGFMVGPFDWKPSSGQMMLAIARQPMPLAPGGGCSVVDVRDVARGILQILNAPRVHGHYILAGANISYLQLWREMAKIVGRRGPLLSMGRWMANLVGAGGTLMGICCGREFQVNLAALQMGQVFHYYSSAKAAADFGYTMGDYRQALSDAWRWFGEHGYRPRSHAESTDSAATA